MAGRNADGAMLLHTNDACSFSTGWDYCGDLGPYSAPLPATCDELVTTTTRDIAIESIVWMVAAFADASSPSVKSFQTGLYGDITPDMFSGWGFCPSNGLEIPDATWPGPNSGTAVTYLFPAITSHLFKIYYFACGAPFSGAIMRSGDYVGGDHHAEWADDSDPAVIDYVFRFGSVGWGVAGSKDCPIPPTTGACCFPDGTCQVLDETICTGQGGAFQGLGTVCDPNPCPPPRGACCFVDGSCIDLLEADCATQGGTWEGFGTDCATFQCPQPQPEACCFTDGSCQNLLADACRTAGGTPEGQGTNCDTFQCPQPPTGACCVGTDCTITTQDGCSGLWQGPDTTCEPVNPCATPVRSTTWGAIKGQYR